MRRLRMFLSAGALLLVQVAAVRAQCNVPFFSGINRDHDRTKIVMTNDVKAMVAGGIASLQAGYEKWNSAPCAISSQPHPFPTFSETAGTETVRIEKSNGISTPVNGSYGCADFTFGEKRIRLFTQIPHPDTGVLHSCDWGDPDVVGNSIAHELGHYLGLAENSSCSGAIMTGGGITFSGGFAWQSGTRAIKMEECEKADQLSYTSGERDWDDYVCSADPACYPYAPCNSSPGCTCPILIDLDRDQFHLAGPAGSVLFDIDADGLSETITWTAVNQADAFLCRDLNGNGAIDDGTELFGNSTPLGHGGIAPFGFIALAELDEPWSGGDGDGLISASDAAFAELCVWLDANQNGISEPAELQSLDHAGVLAIEIGFITYPRRDRWGNLMLYNGRAWIVRNGQVKQTATTDVFFVELP